MKQKYFSVRSIAAFTLVELLVVIAIIGVLIALLLPAVQAAREAARRTQCINKIKQLALACHNYHSTSKVLPPGSSPFNNTEASHGRMRKNAFVCLLPYIEQEALYDLFVGTYSTTSPSANNEVWNTSLDSLLCPSDANRRSSPNARGRTSYRLCVGDWLDEPGRGPRNFANPRGVFVTNGRSRDRNSSVYRTLTCITDGTSNTIMFSEAAIGNGSGDGGLGTVDYVDNTTQTPLRGAIAYYNTPGIPQCEGNPADTSTDFSTCRSYKDGRFYTTTGATYRVAKNLMGFRWGETVPWDSLFSTILPPNSPSCNNGNNGDWRHPMLISASSYHVGGVVCGVADGTARFISETIEAGMGDRCVEAGASPFGVWGALGSIEGGESVALP